MRRLAALATIAFAVLACGLPAGAAPDTWPEVEPVPDGFHWGVAISGFQAEGSAPDSNWSRYSDEENFLIPDVYGDAADFRHRYRDDVRLAAEMGVNTFRFSAE